MIAPQFIEEPLWTLFGNLQRGNPLELVLFRNNILGQHRYPSKKRINQRHIARAVGQVAGFAGIERQLARFRASAKTRRVDRLSEQIIGRKTYIKIQVAYARKLQQGFWNFNGEFSGDISQLSIDRLPSAAGLGEISSHHLVERRRFTGIVELQSRRQLARQQSIVGFNSSLMLDDDQFRADNGYDTMRLDIGQQLIPKTVVIRHHAPVS